MLKSDYRFGLVTLEVTDSTIFHSRIPDPDNSAVSLNFLALIIFLWFLSYRSFYFFHVSSSARNILFDVKSCMHVYASSSFEPAA